SPIVVPLSGSAATSGIGMNGAVAGLNQREMPAAAVDGGGFGTVCGAVAGDTGTLAGGTGTSVGGTAGTCAATRPPSARTPSASSAGIAWATAPAVRPPRAGRRTPLTAT